MLSLNYKKLLIWVAIWIVIQLCNIYLGFSTQMVTIVLLYLFAKQFFKLINYYRFKKPMTEGLVIFGTCATLIFLSIDQRLLSRIEFQLLKSARMKVVKDFESGKIKPNVGGGITLYKPQMPFPVLSADKNQIGLDSGTDNSIRVKFYSPQTIFLNPKPNLVYSTDKLFNSRVEHLQLIDPKNNEKIEENWYRTVYHPGVLMYPEIDESIK